MSAMHIRPYAFDRVFNLGAPKAPDADSAVDAIELEELRDELDVLKQQHQTELALSRAEAFEAGLAHARSERDAALLAAIDALQATFEAEEERRDAALAALSADAAELALAVGETIAARAMDDAPVQAIDDAIGRVLRQIARGQEVAVHVHPELAEAMGARIAERQQSDRRQLNLHIVADPAVPVGDASIEWDTGGITLDAEARRAAVREELRQLGA